MNRWLRSSAGADRVRRCRRARATACSHTRGGSRSSATSPTRAYFDLADASGTGGCSSTGTGYDTYVRPAAAFARSAGSTIPSVSSLLRCDPGAPGGDASSTSCCTTRSTCPARPRSTSRSPPSSVIAAPSASHRDRGEAAARRGLRRGAGHASWPGLWTYLPRRCHRAPPGRHTRAASTSPRRAARSFADMASSSAPRRQLVA